MKDLWLSLQWHRVFCFSPSRAFERRLVPPGLSALLHPWLSHLWIQSTGLLSEEDPVPTCVHLGWSRSTQRPPKDWVSSACDFRQWHALCQKAKVILHKPPANWPGGPERLITTWVSSLCCRVSACPRTSLCMSSMFSDDKREGGGGRSQEWLPLAEETEKAVNSLSFATLLETACLHSHTAPTPTSWVLTHWWPQHS